MTTVRVKLDSEQLYNGRIYAPDDEGYADIPEELAIALGIAPAAPAAAKKKE